MAIINKCIDANVINNGGARVGFPRGATNSTGIIADDNYRVTTFSSTLPTTGDVNDTYQHRFDDEEGFHFASVEVTTSGSGVVSGITGKRIEVQSYVIMADAPCNVYFASNTTRIHGSFHLPAQGGVSYPANEPAFRTEVGEALNLISDSGNIDGHLVYKIF